jgi:hypothetical protein
MSQAQRQHNTSQAQPSGITSSGLRIPSLLARIANESNDSQQHDEVEREAKHQLDIVPQLFIQDPMVIPLVCYWSQFIAVMQEP